MAANFKISVHQNGDNLNLVMQGDFDGTSACELLDVLKNKCNGVDTVFIDTIGLNEIYPFGQDTFQNNLYVLKPQPIRFVFTGKNATKIAPERNKFCHIMPYHRSSQFVLMGNSEEIPAGLEPTFLWRVEKRKRWTKKHASGDE